MPVALLNALDTFMAATPDSLWLSLNPQLRRFDQRLCNQLNRQADVQCWNYQQTADEPCCIDTALALLHEYMQLQPQPIHLIGHSLSGALGLLYTRIHPHRVKSLTLLSVGANPAVSWHSHYYVTRKLLPCDRNIILGQMACMLFGFQHHSKITRLVKLLAQVLDTEFAPHSLVHHGGFASGGVEVPLLVCHGAHDIIIDPNAQGEWQKWLKPGDRLWSCPEGRHFFHHDYPQHCSQVILDFWQQVSASNHLPLIECFL